LGGGGIWEVRTIWHIVSGQYLVLLPVMLPRLLKKTEIWNL
jgi:hypothetical protein